MWDFLEYPETSKMSQVFHSSSMVFVFLSTVTFLIESSHEYGADESGSVNFSSTTLVILKGRTIDNGKTNSFNLFVLPLVLEILDMISLGFFTLEFLLRLFFSPNKKIFMMDPLNFVDFIAIAPFYLAILLEEFQDLQIIGKASKLIRILRLMRILRIFKMVRHFVGLQSLCYTIYQAYKVSISK